MGMLITSAGLASAASIALWRKEDRVKAYQLSRWQAEPEVREVPVPEPGPGQVLVKIGGAGACHSDLHLIESPGNPRWRLPFTLGHENAGWVEKAGAGVSGLRPGDPVLVYCIWGWGACEKCRIDLEQYCENSVGITDGAGLGHDGGIAEYMLVPSARFLLPLRTLHPRDAAPLADAGLTPYHAVKRSLQLLKPGSTAVVIGTGGLGQMAIQIIKAITPARVIAVDTAEQKLQAASSKGADQAVRSGDEAATEIRELTGGKGAEVVLDIVGIDATMKLAAEVARPLGQVTVVGVGGGTLPFNFMRVPLQCSFSTTYYGTKNELMEVIELAESARLRADIEFFAIDQAGEAYRRLHRGAVHGRAVITPR
jgi:propanol-preferring alcohol dehydrogenase